MPSDRDGRASELVIRTLYEISGEYNLGLKHQIHRILQLGLERFDLNIGILSKIEGDTYTVVQQISPPHVALQNGVEFPLGRTYCSITMAANGPVGFEHVATSGISSHPAYKDFGLESYVGAPVQVKHKPYGTLNFSSPEPKPRAFSAVDIDALKLMAAWVGSELSRRQTEHDLRQAKEMLEQQSREDQLTGLYNRRGLEQMLARLARRSGCAEHPLVGIVIDVDDFKSVNDKFGHAVGDRALVEIAQAISDSVRPNDICGRVGGDEFMVLLPSCAMPEASGIAERIRDTVNALKLETGSRAINPSVSVGLVALPAGVTAVTDALAALGPALKRAKADGKNVVAF